MLAKENHHENIVALLKPINDLFDAIKNEDFENVEKYTTEGVYIHLNIKDKDGRTPLHHASGELEVVKWLVENGSNVNAKDINEKTPLVIVIEQGHTPIIEYLRSFENEEA
uniref:Uncharacterized protein n=1 Tax=Acrobeloides nanus TaxID=290746 RepID=A0A914DSA1_9BILA